MEIVEVAEERRSRDHRDVGKKRYFSNNITTMIYTILKISQVPVVIREMKAFSL